MSAVIIAYLFGVSLYAAVVTAGTGLGNIDRWSVFVMAVLWPLSVMVICGATVGDLLRDAFKRSA